MAVVKPKAQEPARLESKPTPADELPELAALGALLMLGIVIAVNFWAYGSATRASAPFGFVFLPWGSSLDTPNIDPVFEVRDRLIWIGALVVAAALGLLGAASRRVRVGRRASAVMAALAAGSLLVSASWQDASIGLGPANVLLALVMLPLVVTALGPRGARAMPAVAILAAIMLAYYLPAMLQTPRGVFEPIHASFIIEDMLGPAAGNFPLGDYVPAYGGLLGLPLVPFRGLIADDIGRWIVGYLTLLSVGTIAVLCVAAAKMLPEKRGWLAPLLVVPPILMKPAPLGQLLPSGAQAFYQAIPVRSLLPACVGLLLLLAIANPGRRGHWLVLGLLAGFTAISNFESGAPATLAALTVMFAVRAGWRAAMQFSGAWVAAWFSYWIVLLVSGETMHLGYWVALSAAFANHLLDLPMPVYGPYALILVTLVVATATGFAASWRRLADLVVPAAGGLYFGAWGLMTFPYYVARSSSWGQLQFFLISAAMSAVWLVALAAAVAHSDRGTWPRLTSPALLACCLPAAIFASSVIKAPAPQQEWGRLSGQFGQTSQWGTFSAVNPTQAAQIAALADQAAEPVGLLVAYGHVASLRTGLPNASLFGVPGSALIGDAQRRYFGRLQCSALHRGSLNSVIADDPAVVLLGACTGFSAVASQDGYVVITRNPLRR